jgi:hypothetical protein
MFTTKRLALLALMLTTTSACVGREIFFVASCDDRLASPYKRDECRACVMRPHPHKYLPDQPDGARCYQR